MLGALVPIIGGALGSGAMGNIARMSAGLAMGYWASTNVYQTSRISGDNKARLELDWAEYEQQQRYLDLREQELDPDSYYNFAQRAWQEEDAIRDQMFYQENITLQDQLYKQNQQRQYAYDMSQTAFEYGLDSQLQADRLQTEVELDTRRITLQDEERNLYLQNVAFDTSQAILQQYNFMSKNKSDQEIALEILKLSYIISELEKLENNNIERIAQPMSSPEYSEDPNFDYSLWQPTPDD